MRTKHIFVVVLLLPFVFVSAQWQEKYESKMWVDGQDTLRYRIMYPKNFNESQDYPVVLFLHGAGERGIDNKKQLVHGGKLFANDSIMEKFPAIVLFPQCPTESYWSNVDVDRSSYPITLKFKYEDGPTRPMELVMNLLEHTLDQTFTNKNRVYIAGLSMGGMGTFELLYRKPDTFAAAIAICGAGNPSSVDKYAAHTPLWVFHGAQDNVVKPMQSLEMVSALISAGAYPKFTLYDDANHNSWDSAFAEPDLLPWLFSKNTLTH